MEKNSVFKLSGSDADAINIYFHILIDLSPSMLCYDSGSKDLLILNLESMVKKFLRIMTLVPEQCSKGIQHPDFYINLYSFGTSNKIQLLIDQVQLNQKSLPEILNIFKTQIEMMYFLIGRKQQTITLNEALNQLFAKMSLKTYDDYISNIFVLSDMICLSKHDIQMNMKYENIKIFLFQVRHESNQYDFGKIVNLTQIQQFCKRINGTYLDYQQYQDINYKNMSIFFHQLITRENYPDFTLEINKKNELNQINLNNYQEVIVVQYQIHTFHQTYLIKLRKKQGWYQKQDNYIFIYNSYCQLQYKFETNIVIISAFYEKSYLKYQQSLINGQSRYIKSIELFANYVKEQDIFYTKIQDMFFLNNEIVEVRDKQTLQEFNKKSNVKLWDYYFDVEYLSYVFSKQQQQYENFVIKIQNLFETFCDIRLSPTLFLISINLDQLQYVLVKFKWKYVNILKIKILLNRQSNNQIRTLKKRINKYILNQIIRGIEIKKFPLNLLNSLKFDRSMQTIMIKFINYHFIRKAKYPLRLVKNNRLIIQKLMSQKTEFTQISYNICYKQIEFQGSQNHNKKLTIIYHLQIEDQIIRTNLILYHKNHIIGQMDQNQCLSCSQILDKMSKEIFEQDNLIFSKIATSLYLQKMTILKSNSESNFRMIRKLSINDRMSSQSPKNIRKSLIKQKQINFFSVDKINQQKQAQHSIAESYENILQFDDFIRLSTIMNKNTYIKTFSFELLHFKNFTKHQDQINLQIKLYKLYQQILVNSSMFSMDCLHQTIFQIKDIKGFLYTYLQDDSNIVCFFLKEFEIGDLEIQINEYFIGSSDLDNFYISNLEEILFKKFKLDLCEIIYQALANFQIDESQFQKALDLYTKTTIDIPIQQLIHFQKPKNYKQLDKIFNNFLQFFFNKVENQQNFYLQNEKPHDYFQVQLLDEFTYQFFKSTRRTTFNEKDTFFLQVLIRKSEQNQENEETFIFQKFSDIWNQKNQDKDVLQLCFFTKLDQKFNRTSNTYDDSTQFSYKMIETKQMIEQLIIQIKLEYYRQNFQIIPFNIIMIKDLISKLHLIHKGFFFHKIQLYEENMNHLIHEEMVSNQTQKEIYFEKINNIYILMNSKQNTDPIFSDSEFGIPFWMIIQIQDDTFQCFSHIQFCHDYDWLNQKLQSILINIIKRVNTHILINKLTETMYCPEMLSIDDNQQSYRQFQVPIVHKFYFPVFQRYVKDEALKNLLYNLGFDNFRIQNMKSTYLFIFEEKNYILKFQIIEQDENKSIELIVYSQNDLSQNAINFLKDHIENSQVYDIIHFICSSNIKNTSKLYQADYDYILKYGQNNNHQIRFQTPSILKYLIMLKQSLLRVFFEFKIQASKPLTNSLKMTKSDIIDPGFNIHLTDFLTSFQFFLNHLKLQTDQIYLKNFFGVCAIIMNVKIYNAENMQNLCDQDIKQNENQEYIIEFDIQMQGMLNYEKLVQYLNEIHQQTIQDYQIEQYFYEDQTSLQFFQNIQKLQQNSQTNKFAIFYHNFIDLRDIINYSVEQVIEKHLAIKDTKLQLNYFFKTQEKNEIIKQLTLKSKNELLEYYEIFFTNIELRIKYQPEIGILFTGEDLSQQEVNKLKIFESSEILQQKVDRNFFVLIQITQKKLFLSTYNIQYDQFQKLKQECRKLETWCIQKQDIYNHVLIQQLGMYNIYPKLQKKDNSVKKDQGILNQLNRQKIPQNIYRFKRTQNYNYNQKSQQKQELTITQQITSLVNDKYPDQGYIYKESKAEFHKIFEQFQKITLKLIKPKSISLHTHLQLEENNFSVDIKKKYCLRFLEIAREFFVNFLRRTTTKILIDSNNTQNKQNSLIIDNLVRNFIKESEQIYQVIFQSKEIVPFSVSMKALTKEQFNFEFQTPRSSISDFLSDMEKNDKKDFKNDLKLTNELIDKLFNKCIKQSESLGFQSIYHNQNENSYLNYSQQNEDENPEQQIYYRCVLKKPTNHILLLQQLTYENNQFIAKTYYRNISNKNDFMSVQEEFESLSEKFSLKMLIQDSILEYVYQFINLRQNDMISNIDYRKVLQKMYKQKQKFQDQQFDIFQHRIKVKFQTNYKNITMQDVKSYLKQLLKIVMLGRQQFFIVNDNIQKVFFDDQWESKPEFDEIILIEQLNPQNTLEFNFNLYHILYSTQQPISDIEKFLVTCFRKIQKIMETDFFFQNICTSNTLNCQEINNFLQISYYQSHKVIQLNQTEQKTLFKHIQQLQGYDEQFLKFIQIKYNKVKIVSDETTSYIIFFDQPIKLLRIIETKDNRFINCYSFFDRKEKDFLSQLFFEWLKYYNAI